MNNSGDIVVAFHTSRTDFTPNLKQVEIVYFQFVPGANPSLDSWVFLNRKLLGSVPHNPLFKAQLDVKCERPDVVAVGDKFFVVWTRRYDRSVDVPNQIDEPAVLECAWLERSGSTLLVHGASGGLGFPLDASYFVRECAGVPDAVALKQAAGGLPTVGIAYPRQTDFGDYTGDDTRLFELAFVTSSLNGSAVQATVPKVLHDQIPFDGPTAPGGGTSAGLVLPDLAASSEVNAFWVAFEGQELASPDVFGRIRMEYWKKSGSWNPEVVKVFHTTHPMTTVARRRPMLSSLPGTGNGEEVSITFNRASGNAGSSDLDIVYEQWAYLNGGIQPVAVPAGTGFVNNAGNSDHKPVGMHGPSAPYLRRIYFDRATTSGQGIFYYDTDTNSEVSIISSATAARAAVSYGKPSGSTDTIALHVE